MDPTPSATSRCLYFIAAALLVEAALGFLPTVRAQEERQMTIQLIHAACAGLAGGAVLIAARQLSSPTMVRALLWATFLAIGGTKIATQLVMIDSTFMWNSTWLFGTASWSMIGFGAPVLWGSALGRREDPENLLAQKAGRLSAGVVQLGFVFLFASEIRTWGMISRMYGSGGFGAAYGASQAMQIVDRVLLLWASIESVRTAVDADTIRLRAAKIHKLMIWWLLLYLLSGCVYQVLLQTQMQGSWVGSSIQASLVQILIHQTLPLAAAAAVALHFWRQKRTNEPVVSGSGAEA